MKTFIQIAKDFDNLKHYKYCFAILTTSGVDMYPYGIALTADEIKARLELGIHPEFVTILELKPEFFNNFESKERLYVDAFDSFFNLPTHECISN